jgi:hypothetical protein
MVASMYLCLVSQDDFVANTCKKFFLVEVRTLRYLNKYLFREKKCNNILERDAWKIYVHWRMKIVNLCSEDLMVYL